MNKLFKVVFLTFACLLVTASAFAQYTEFVVEPGGSSTTYPDLATAVATAQTFTGEHRIVIRAGTYTDAGVFIDHTQPGVIREIVGDGTDVVFFQGPAAGIFPPASSAGTFLDVRATTGLLITGLNISGYDAAVATWGAAAVDLVWDDCLVDGCIAGFYGGATDGQFTNLTITNCWIGIGLTSMVGGEAIDGNLIDHCVFQGMTKAPAVFVTTDDKHDLVSAGVNAATSADNNTVSYCQVMECSDQGIMFANNGATQMLGNMIQYNVVYDVQFNGIALMGTGGGGVLYNDVYNCTQGSVNPDSTLLTNTWAKGAIDLYGCSGVTVRYNTVYDNGGSGTMGDGGVEAGYANYGIAVNTAGDNHVIRDNCLFGHVGIQGTDDGDGTVLWRQNYYSDLATNAGFPNYNLDGTAAEQDGDPWLYNNSASGLPTVEVYYDYDVTIDWTVPACDPFSPTPLAAFEFTVKWDPLFFTLNTYDYDAFWKDAGNGALWTTITTTDSSATFAATNFENPLVGDGPMAVMQFHAIKTGATQIRVASYYRDPNNVDIPTGTTPLDVTVQDTEDPTITLSVTDDVLGYNTFGNNYPLEVQGSVADNYGLYRVYYAIDGGGYSTVESVTGLTDTYGPFNPNISALSDGLHTLHMRVRDVSGRYGYAHHDFTIDNTGPTVSGLTLTDADGCANAGWTSNELIDVAWTDDGAVEHQFWLTAAEGFLTYENPTTYTLPSVAGTYTLYVQLKDIFGNAGPWSAGVPITLDKTLPNPTAAWLVSNPTPAKTNTATIVGDFNMDVANGTVFFKWSDDTDDLDCDDAGWMAAPPAVRPFPITLNGQDGLKTIFMASKDAAGNVAYTSASITLDTEAPELDAFAIHSLTGEECASTNNFMAVYEFGASDIVQLQYSWDDASWGFWKNLTGLPSPDSAAGSFATIGDGWKKIYARLVDDIGNLGASMVDSIYVDMTAPAVATVDIVDRAATAAAIVGNYSNEPAVNISLTGLSADVTHLLVTEDGWATSTSIDISAGSPFTSPYVVPYTYVSSFTECGQRTLGINVKDCAGNTAVAINDNIRFDLTLPVASSFTGPATTTGLAVALNISASDNCSLYWMRITEDGSSVPPVWQVFSATPTFNLEDKTPASNDGVRRLHLEVADRAGNIDVDGLYIDIDVDMTAPAAGDFSITSGNPLALPGYTGSRYGNTICFTPADADVVQVQIRNSDGTSNTNWFTVSGSYPECFVFDSLAAGPDGIRTVRYRYKDDAGNIGGWWDETISLSTVAPPAPVAVTGGWVPGGSADLTWHSVANAYRYYLRYNFMNEYPTYGSPIPPSPATMGQGIPIPGLFVEDTTYTFDGPHMDIFTMSIWALDAYGNYSAPMLDQMLGTNYRLGDHVDDAGNPGADGCLQFATDFGDLADAYNSVFGGTYFNDELDIAPTSDNSEIGYPIPDGAVNFEDLIIFSLNYRWSRQQPECTGGAKKVAAGAAAGEIASAVSITVETPAYVRTGDQFSMPIKLDNTSGIIGYHLTLDFDHNLLEVVSVAPGEGYASIAESFFWVNGSTPELDIHSAILSNTDLEGEDLAVVTFRAVSSGTVSIEDKLLDVRNIENDKAEVSFSMAAKGGALPTSFALSQNYPNPFNPTTTIELSLPVASHYRLSIYNILGQEVQSFEGYSEAGYINLTWDASEHSSGVYLYKVVAGDFTSTRKMVLLK